MDSTKFFCDYDLGERCKKSPEFVFVWEQNKIGYYEPPYVKEYAAHIICCSDHADLRFFGPVRVMGLIKMTISEYETLLLLKS
jgi:hypothetical protein